MTLGPVSERVVMVRQGQTVVLECRDADADSRVYWTKHGGEYSDTCPIVDHIQGFKMKGCFD